jgi:4-hydroxybenzoate polyprenyltransferase
MKRLAEIIKPFLQLLRIGNLAFLVILLYVMEKWVAAPLLQQEQFGELMPWWILTLLILSVVCVAAGGYVINDYFDVKIDRINRPDDLIVTRFISRDAAMYLFYIFTAVGLVAGAAVSWWAHSWTLLFTYVVIPGLLWFYSASYKRMFLIGNLVVAFASAIVPLLVAIANADYLRHLYQEALAYSPIVGELYVWTGGFAAFAFLLTWAREMVKDIEDIEGDREMECRTLPIVWGQKSAKIFVTSLLLVVTAIIVYMLLAVLPFPHEWKSLPTRYVVFGLIVPILCSIVLLWAANNRTELHRVQTIIKFTMFMGVLFSYVVAMNLR